MKFLAQFRFLLLTALFAGGAAYELAAKPRPAALSTNAPSAAIKQFTVADGLEVSLFASEPMVVNPTDMDVDERGRVWITEGVNYRSSFKEWGILRPQG